MHANFIVNPKRSACAADIEVLIAHVRAVVQAKTGVELEPEVRILGEADDERRSRSSEKHGNTDR